MDWRVLCLYLSSISIDQALALRALYILGNLTANSDDTRSLVFTLSENCELFFSLLVRYRAADATAKGSKEESLVSARPDSPNHGSSIRESADLLVKVLGIGNEARAGEKNRMGHIKRCIKERDIF